MQDRKIPVGRKLGYGVGQVAEGLKNTSFGLFALFFYNQVLGVPGTLCGLALGIALIFDAVTDPLAGSLSDNLRSRMGRRHPFMIAAALPLGLFFFALFSPPRSLNEMQLFIWLLVFAVLTRAAMTLFHVPHMALGAELTENFEERTSIVAYRLAFGYLGGVLTAVVAFGWFFADARGGRMNPDAYSPFALLLGIAMAATILLSAWATRREIPHLPGPTGERGLRILPRLVLELRSTFRNDSFRWLFAGVLIVFLMVGVDAALGLYMNEFFWELTGSQILLVSMVSPIGLVVGSLFTRALHERWDKKPGLVLGTAGWALLQVLPVALRLLGWFPGNGSDPLLWTLVVFRFAQGMIVQQALVSFGSMMADVVDEHELESGQRQEGIFFGAVAFSGKGASGLGSLIAGVGLDLIAWPGGRIASAAELDPGTLTSLGLLSGPAVSIFAFLAVWCYAHYGLHRSRHREILAELERVRARKRGPAGAPGAAER